MKSQKRHLTIVELQVTIDFLNILNKNCLKEILKKKKNCSIVFPDFHDYKPESCFGLIIFLYDLYCSLQVTRELLWGHTYTACVVYYAS